jgi:hypothetical protein
MTSRGVRGLAGIARPTSFAGACWGREFMQITLSRRVDFRLDWTG